jgi:hypothetical protein
LPQQQPDPLTAALARYAAIDAALRAGGPNPLPDELTEGAWQEHLAAFQVGGPYDCTLLQDAENAVEILAEMLPDDADQDDGAAAPPVWTGLAPGERDPWDDYHARACPAVAVQLPGDAAPAGPLQEECLRLYAESLPSLTEDELRADLISAEDAGREDTAALIRTELGSRERETPLPAVTFTLASSGPPGWRSGAPAPGPRRPAPRSV